MSPLFSRKILNVPFILLNLSQIAMAIFSPGGESI